MERVLVICGAGASSTFLVHWMRKAAADRHLELVLQAGSLDDVESRLADIDIVLVGEHLAAQFPGVLLAASAAGVRAALLPALSFDPAGAAVALDLVSELGTRPLAEARSVAPTDQKDRENNNG